MSQPNASLASFIKKKRIAIVYDRINKWGGAERVLLFLHELFPNAPLYTSVYNKQKAPWAKAFMVKTSWLQKLPGASTSHELFPFLMPIAFENFSFDEYDMVISVSSEAAKGIITKPTTVHINYCLTPTRYLWSGYKEYFTNELTRFLTFPVVSYLRAWDKIAAHRPDRMIAISKEVQHRIKKYYTRDSDVVYPPLSLDTRTEIPAKKKKVSGLLSLPENYFLVVSRLVHYKRIDIAIEACNQLQAPLVIIGSGNEESRLRELAGSTIFFKSVLTDEELVGYYKGCRALLFPGIEDFGLAVVEAQLFGKPVIALREGGAQETIIEGKTGEFFFPQSAKALQEKLATFDPADYKAKDCQEQARKFSKEQFQDAFIKVIAHYFS